MGLRPSLTKTNNRIGIDLATKTIGVAVFIDGDRKQFMGFEVHLENTNHWDKTLFEELKQIVGDTDFYKDFEIYIEVGNFGSPLMTQKFAYLAGMLAAMFYNLGCEVVYLVRPQAWFNALLKRDASKKYFTQGLINNPRNERKQIAIDELIEDLKKDVSFEGEISDITNDIADAYFIARYGNRCLHAFWDKKHKEKFKKKIKNEKK